MTFRASSMADQRSVTALRRRRDAMIKPTRDRRRWSRVRRRVGRRTDNPVRSGFETGAWQRLLPNPDRARLSAGSLLVDSTWAKSHRDPFCPADAR
jgi:hypothetical protein